MLHFQKLDVYQRSIEFLATRPDKARHYTIARGSAMESAAHLDVMQVEDLIEADLYARGIDLLERIVAMLTRLIAP